MKKNSFFLTPPEVQERLQISYSSLRRLIKKGSIPYVRVGSLLRFPSSYFDELNDEAINEVKEMVS